MSSQPPPAVPADEGGASPLVTEEKPSRRGTWGVAAVIAVLLITAGIFGLRALADKNAAEPEVTTSTHTSATDEPETLGASTPAGRMFTGKPSKAWQATASSLGLDGGKLTIAAASQPEQSSTAQVLVALVSTPAGAGKSTHIALGLDRVTGKKVWQVELQEGPQAGCFTLGDGTTVACAIEIDSETGQSDVTYLTAATGDQLMVQHITTRPRTMSLDTTGIVTTGVDMSNHRIVITSHDAITFDEQWTATSDANTVLISSTAADSVTAADGSFAVSLSGASLVVDRTSGVVQMMATDAVITLAPGLIITTPTTGTTTIADSTGSPLLNGVGNAWTYAGPMESPVPVIGIAGDAAETTTGDELWRVPGAKAAVGLTGIVIGSEVVLSNLTTQSPIKCVEALTGDAVWTSLAVSGAISIHDGTLFSETSGTIVGVDLVTGEALWTLEHEAETPANTLVLHVVGATVVTEDAGTAVGYTFR